MKGAWIFPLIVGVAVGLVIGQWSNIVNLIEHKQQLAGASKIASGLADWGINL